MPARTSRYLVVNASVAQASGGEDAVLPRSKYCRDFLMAVRTICHCIVMTSEISREWKEHQSNFARQWRVSMEARKKVCRVDVASYDELYGKIEYVASNEKDRDAMLKDFPLIEAALSTDRTVISLDEKARRLFSGAAQNVSELKSVVWVNPEKAEEQPIRWLKDGAKSEKSRQLGFGWAETRS